MTTATKRRVSGSESPTVRALREAGYDRLRTHVVVRQSAQRESEQKKRRRLLLIGVLSAFPMGLTLLAVYMLVR